jgi:hypothetical protein
VSSFALNNWNAYFRPDRQSRWSWIGSGPTYGAANGEAVLRSTGGKTSWSSAA